MVHLNINVQKFLLLPLLVVLFQPFVSLAASSTQSTPKTAVTKPPISAATPSWGSTPATPYANLTSAEKGRWLWLKYNCASCHGDNGAGGMGPNVIHEDGLTEILKKGEKGMPTYKTLTATDASNLAAYLQSINKVNEPHFQCWYKDPIKDRNYDPALGTPRPDC